MIILSIYRFVFNGLYAGASELMTANSEAGTSMIFLIVLLPADRACICIFIVLFVG